MLAAEREVDAIELYRQMKGNPFFVTEVPASRDGPIPGHGSRLRARSGRRARTGGKRLLEAVAICRLGPSSGCSRRWRAE